MKSVVSYPERGEGGNNKYRGNCSPKLIEDIIDQYKLESLSDFMVGSGTTEDVCKKAGLRGGYYDLNRGFDMVDMDMPERAENIFWHPPYGDIIVYSDKMYSANDIIEKHGFDPRVNDLSRCKDWESFVKSMNYCMMKQFSALEKNGRMFVLMGDVKKKGKLYSMLCDIIKPGTLEQIIIKMQHNCWSDHRSYGGRFVPIVHEYLMVVRKDGALVFPVKLSKNQEYDVRDSRNVTWRDVVASVLEDAGRSLSLKDIYEAVDGHKKCEKNPHWKEKIRQVLRMYPTFQCVGEHKYQLAA